MQRDFNTKNTASTLIVCRKPDKVLSCCAITTYIFHRSIKEVFHAVIIALKSSIIYILTQDLQ